MPIFEYICVACGFKFDYLLRNSQECVCCPKCKKNDLRKLVSAFSFNAKDKTGNVTSSSGCSGCTSSSCAGCAH